MRCAAWSNPWGSPALAPKPIRSIETLADLVYPESINGRLSRTPRD